MKIINIIYLAAFLFVGCDDSASVVDTNSGNGNPPPPTSSSGEVILITDSFEGKDLILAGNETDNYIVSFERSLGGELLNFTAVNDQLPIIMTDNEGNEWDIFGHAASGPRKGERLRTTQSLMGYWFSFATFYPGIDVYPSSDKGVYEGKVITGSGDWLVPKNEVRSGGVGRDGIPAISNPQFTNTSTVDFLDNDDLVVGFRQNSSIRAYPHDVLDWHEIVNDEMDNLPYSIIYCPLTGTATVWGRTINGLTTTFGVSGLLYNTNIVPYDRATESNWSQLFDKAVFGTLKGQAPENYPMLETKWSTWEKIAPNSEVMNFETGFNRSYGRYPYGDYKTDLGLIFPVKYHDTRMHAKERVHAVIVNEKAKVYRFTSFRE